MDRRAQLCLATTLAVAALPGVSGATRLGTARTTSVVAVDGGCVSGPAGQSVQSWALVPGKTYTITITNVTECSGATIGVRVNSSSSGNTDAVATRISTGTYSFNYTMPAGAGCTMPIFYCTTPGRSSTGFQARRDDGASFQSHLQASAFAAGCTNPQGVNCGTTAAQSHTWGMLKTIYR